MGAAAAALTALKQAHDFKKEAEQARVEAKRLRTFDYSAYNVPQVQEARAALDKYFAGLDSLTSDDVSKVLKEKEILGEFNVLLNHWGRFATAYRLDLVDKNTSRELLRFGFVRYWQKYGNYIDGELNRRPGLSDQYKDLLFLKTEWLVS